jgi:hypothetical protein
VSLENILAELDEEIRRLEGAKALLAEVPVKRGPGRPSSGGSSKSVPKTRKRPQMSAEGRARIAAAQKARWAKIRKAASKAA